MNYFPGPRSNWAKVEPSKVGFNTNRLAEAIEFALNSETYWPRDLGDANKVPGLTDIEPAPWNEPLGIFKPRGGPNGVVIKGGKLVALWGDPERADMTFSIAKSYLAILTGIAVSDGLIPKIDATVASTIKSELFKSPNNSKITWRHLLNQTSEWNGTLFGKPDQVDHFRQVGPKPDNSRKGQKRKLQMPGTFWEYNDVRVNLLSLALMHVFQTPLPKILKKRIMDPIGASNEWSWHGYRNSWVEINDKSMLSVPGGTHWGGGIHISSLDHARFGLLVHRNGVWENRQILPKKWCMQLRSPCPINENYGFLWWLNTRKNHWPNVPENAYAAKGAGTNLIWISPDDDIVIVARWIDPTREHELLCNFMAALN
ncbi:MAG: serine hydrolase [Magnetovibrio sp.]|nr:serine hydrolase [Magnetovibrio sp.]